MNITIKAYENGTAVELKTTVQPNMGDLNRPMKKAAIAFLKQQNRTVAEIFCVCDRCQKEQPILSVGKNEGGNGYYDWFVQHTCV